LNRVNPMNRKSILKQLARARDGQQLVSLERKAIDPHPIRGFVLDFSSKLLLLQTEYDFYIDGFQVVRIKDISHIRVGSKTDRFQKQLLQDEGLLNAVKFDYRIDLTNWKTALSELMETHPFLILEYESLNPEEENFFFGTPLRCKSRSLSLRFFCGDGSWLDKPPTVQFKKLTRCKFDCNYLNVYQRYFERQAAQSEQPPARAAKPARSR
jgi:hypothetical protein